MKTKDALNRYLSPMRVLVTGCAGLIGSNFCDWLASNQLDFHIVGIDNLSGGYLENINNKVEFYEYDLNDYSRVEELFKEHMFTYVFHFAAYAAEGLSPFIRRFNYSNNLLVTTNIVNCCIKYNVKRLIYTSSMATYGWGDGSPPFSETTNQKPIDPYGIAKLSAEMDIKVAAEQHGLEYCIIRPHNVYGKKQNIWDKYRNVLGIWMRKLINNEPLTIYGDGLQTRAFTYIDDIVRPLWIAAVSDKTRNEDINLGGEKEITLNDAATTLCDVVGRGEIVWLEKRHEVKHAWCTVDKSVELLEFKESVTLSEGLRRMWEWANEQPKREVKIWKEYEIEKNIYSFWNQALGVNKLINKHQHIHKCEQTNKNDSSD